MNWRPILEGDLAERARAAVDRVATALEAVPVEGHAYSASAAGGSAGFAILFAELAHTGRSGASDRAAAHLDAACSALATTPMQPSLFGGFLSVAWALNLLSADLEEETPAAELEEVLIEHLRTTPWRRDYDLVAGLVGFGVYALGRYPSVFAEQALQLVMDRLAELAVTTDGGVAWFTAPGLLPEHQRREHPDGYFNLGVAHGNPGALAFVGQAVSVGAGGDSARGLLEQGLTWLDRQRLPPGSVSVFPGVVGTGPPNPSRLAWCYGDAGIASALHLAGEDDQAVKLLRTTLQRPMADCWVRDAGLCHGSAGLAHVYNRFFQASGEEQFKAQAIAWIEDALAREDRNDGAGGFPAAAPEGFTSEPGLLGGSAGVALTLLAALEPRPPRWDQLLLLSPAVRAG